MDFPSNALLLYNKIYIKLWIPRKVMLSDEIRILHVFGLISLGLFFHNLSLIRREILYINLDSNMVNRQLSIKMNFAIITFFAFLCVALLTGSVNARPNPNSNNASQLFGANKFANRPLSPEAVKNCN